MIDVKQDLLDFLNGQEDPTSLKGILKGLGYHKNDRQFLRSTLGELVTEGSVIRDGQTYWIENGRARAREIKRAKTRREKELIGRLSVNRAGDGFVASDEGVDWFIPRRSLGRAKHGDTVLAVMTERRRDGRIVAEVDSVESFGLRLILGVFEVVGNSVYFHAFNDFKLDPSELLAMPGDVEDGMVGKFRRQDDGRWRYDGVLGSLEDPKVDEPVVLSENEIAIEFPPEVVAQADAYGADYAFELGDRRDFRNEMVFTVDGATARDFDDALHLRQIDPQEIEVGVHIADVSEFVTPDSPLDVWSRQQGNSTYLPHRAYPMLPEILSNELCSLKPNVPRYTTSVVARVSSAGKVLSFEVCKGLIQSSFRLTYDDVVAIGVDFDKEARAKFAEVSGPIDLALKLSRKLRQRRIKSGGLDMDMPELKIVIDEAHEYQEMALNYQTDANKMIEAFMVMANECIARYLEPYGLPYRVHAPPDEQRLEKFGVFLKMSNVPAPPDLLDNPAGNLNEIIGLLKKRPNADVMQTQLLKTLKMAEYSPDNQGHFGLASTHYAHFTSPIRRYADLVVHQRLKRLLADPGLGPEHFENGPLPEICQHISKKERDSQRAEYAFQRVKLLRRMMSEIGNVFDGVVTEVKNFGMFVDIGEWRVSGMIPVDDLDDDFYEYAADLLALIGKRSARMFKVGLSVKVRITRVDLIGRKLDVELVEGGISARNLPRPKQDHAQDRGRTGARFRPKRDDAKKPRRTLRTKGGKRKKKK